MLSVVLPVYNEQEMIAIASETISRILAERDIPYEILFVEDGPETTLGRRSSWPQSATQRSAV